MMRTVTANGAEIPALGFGTYELTGTTCTRMVEVALSLGYRHLDTAPIYANENAIGEALSASGVARDTVFLTTKVWPDCFRAEAFKRSVAESLKRLRTDYVDLLLLHWPNPEVPLSETIEALNRACDQGLTRHIGVSNFPTRQLEEAIDLSGQPLVMNQVEYHPFLDQTRVLETCRRHRLAVTAYCPLAHGHVARHPLLQQIGEAHAKTSVQVGLRWLIQQEGVLAIPRSSREPHAAANLAIFDFELSDAEMSKISALTQANNRLCNPPELAPTWD
jgi:diketogulonate reductase-like aldo/keto reductase